MKKTTLTALLIAASILASCSKGSNDAQQGMANDTIAEDSVEKELVYTTPHGKRYHLKYCRTIKGHETEGKTREEAEREGRTPCRVCNPYELLPDESDSVAQ